jgi:hypothetical protein
MPDRAKLRRSESTVRRDGILTLRPAVVDFNRRHRAGASEAQQGRRTAGASNSRLVTGSCRPEEMDGPMLRYGLQEIVAGVLAVPAAAHLRPRAEFIEERYEILRKAG